MPSLSDNDVMDDFASTVLPIYERWHLSTPIQNENAIADLIRSAIRQTTVTPLKFFFREMGEDGGGGFFSAPSWVLEINQHWTGTQNVPRHIFKWLCEILYHEARHAEQHSLMLQAIHEGALRITGLSGNGTRNQQIANRMNIHVQAVSDAENTRAYTSLSRNMRTTVACWFDSIYGEQSGHRSDVYARGDRATPGTHGNWLYINLPEEIDAYLIQDRVGARVDRVLPGTMMREGESIDGAIQPISADTPVARSRGQLGFEPIQGGSSHMRRPAPPARIASPTGPINTGAASTVAALRRNFPPLAAVRQTTPMNTVASLQGLSGHTTGS